MNTNNLQILNDVLESLKSNTEDKPLDKEEIYWHANLLFELSNRNKRIIMEKLIRDGYAFRLDDKDGFDKYFISYEGILFLDEGGYVKKFERNLQLAKSEAEYKEKVLYLQKKNVNIQFWAILSAVVASSYYFGEIMKWLLPQLIHRFLLFFHQFLFSFS